MNKDMFTSFGAPGRPTKITRFLIHLFDLLLTAGFGTHRFTPWSNFVLMFITVDSSNLLLAPKFPPSAPFVTDLF